MTKFYGRALAVALVAAFAGAAPAKADPVTILGGGAAGIYIWNEGFAAAEKLQDWWQDRTVNRRLEEQRERFRNTGRY